MSRIIVKNLPKKFSDDKLREKFAQVGTITDCATRHSAEGISRRFAFVGFKNEGDAAIAVEKFDKTYINSCKVQVNLANDLETSAKAKSWSKHTKVDKKRTKPAHKTATHHTPQTDLDLLLKEVENDPDFAEFAAFSKNKPISKRREQNKEEPSSKSELEHFKSKHVGELTDSDSELDEDEANFASHSFRVRVNGLPHKVQEKDVVTFFQPVTLSNLSFTRTSKQGVSASFLVNSEANLAACLKRDKTFYGKTKVFVEREPNASQAKEITKRMETNAETIEPISESGRIYVRNLSYTCTEYELEDIFKRFGDDIE